MLLTGACEALPELLLVLLDDPCEELLVPTLFPLCFKKLLLF